MHMLFKYATEIVVRFHEHSTFVSTNNKNIIMVGEPGCPISAVRGKNVLVANKYAAQLADHNFSLIITPTVALMNDIPLKVDNSWYTNQPYVLLKITATEP